MSPTDICNLALGYLGDEATVQSIAPPESTVQAEQCAKFYPIARDMLLEHGWTFNKRRVDLALIEENPLDSWAFSYAYPSSCLRVLAVLPPSATDDTATEDFIVETTSTGDRVIYTNTEDAIAVYAARVTDTTKWSPAFAVALSYWLASFLAGPIVKGAKGMTIARALRDLAAAATREALAADANSGQQDALYKAYVPSSIAARA